MKQAVIYNKIKKILNLAGFIIKEKKLIFLSRLLLFIGVVLIIVNELRLLRKENKFYKSKLSKERVEEKEYLNRKWQNFLLEEMNQGKIELPHYVKHVFRRFATLSNINTQKKKLSFYPSFHTSFYISNIFLTKKRE